MKYQVRKTTKEASQTEFIFPYLHPQLPFFSDSFFDSETPVGSVFQAEVLEVILDISLFLVHCFQK